MHLSIPLFAYRLLEVISGLKCNHQLTYKIDQTFQIIQIQIKVHVRKLQQMKRYTNISLD